LQRYLDEIGFLWNSRLKREYLSKSGRKRRIVTTIPLPEMLSGLLYSAIGRQVRRTRNYGFSALPSSLPALSRLLSSMQPCSTWRLVTLKRHRLSVCRGTSFARGQMPSVHDLSASSIHAAHAP